MSGRNGKIIKKNKGIYKKTLDTQSRRALFLINPIFIEGTFKRKFLK
jgi:hypothetical protein